MHASRKGPGRFKRLSVCSGMKTLTPRHKHVFGLSPEAKAERRKTLKLAAGRRGYAAFAKRIKKDPKAYRAYLDAKNEKKRLARLRRTQAGLPRDSGPVAAPKAKGGDNLLPFSGTAVLPPVGLEFPMFRRYG